MRWIVGAALAVAVAGLVSGCGTADGGPSGKKPTASGTRSPGKSFGALEEGDVVTINDGDTLTLRDGRKIRLVQIDAPELYDDCYGQAARRAALALIPVGTHVTLQRDPALDATDRYGRLLRYVEAKGLNVNAELVVVGAAVPYFFHGERGRYARDLLAAVDTARAQHAGLWKACPRAKLNPGLGSLTGPA